MIRALIFPVILTAAACASAPTPEVALRHDREGVVLEGSVERLATAIRQGCPISVAWGGRRRNDPARTIEHAATPIWTTVRDGNEVEVQIEGFAANLDTLGVDPGEEPSGGRSTPTDKFVRWRASLKTDGAFEAIWYYPDSGELVLRAPQRHRMTWFANCRIREATPPLFE